MLESTNSSLTKGEETISDGKILQAYILRFFYYIIILIFCLLPFAFEKVMQLIISLLILLLQSKLQWLQEEIQTQLNCRSKIKRSLDRSYSDLQEVLKASEVDKIQYEAKLAKQDETITELKTHHQGKDEDFFTIALCTE